MDMKGARGSRSESNRLQGRHQTPDRRGRILDAAERLFLRDGLERTRMIDIAARAGITKVTLYRYFPNRDLIAVEIYGRMMDRIVSRVGSLDPELPLASVKRIVQVMVGSYGELRDAYRFAAMFDALYLDKPPSAALPELTRERLAKMTLLGRCLPLLSRAGPDGERALAAGSALIWILEKLAVRGEMTWSPREAPIEEYLTIFGEMISGYLDASMSCTDTAVRGGRMTAGKGRRNRSRGGTNGRRK